MSLSAKGVTASQLNGGVMERKTAHRATMKGVVVGMDVSHHFMLELCLEPHVSTVM